MKSVDGGTGFRRVPRREFLTNSSSMLLAAALPLRVGTMASGVNAEKTLGSPVRIQRLSWAGVKIETPHHTLFVDPWVSPDTWDGGWKDSVVPVQASTEQANVLITHLHNDHFDPVAARGVLKDQFSLVCYSEIAATVASKGIRVLTAHLNEPRIVGDFVVTPVPASDGLNEPQVSWVIVGGGRRLIHCGDTLWHGAFWHIGMQHGPFDVAFLPINGVSLLKRRTPDSGIPASMTPEQAVAAGIVLGARKVVPIHYGLNIPGSYVEYANAEATFLRVARERNLPVEIVKPGDWLREDLN